MLYSLREETEGKPQMLSSLRKNGLTSLFKEVTGFSRNEMPCCWHLGQGVCSGGPQDAENGLPALSVCKYCSLVRARPSPRSSQGWVSASILCCLGQQIGSWKQIHATSTKKDTNAQDKRWKPTPPKFWAVKISPPEFREWPSENTVRQQVWGVNRRPSNLGAWVFREVRDA